jgi:hypothetical protein
MPNAIACESPAVEHASGTAPRGMLHDLAALRMLLEQGWRIEAPVLARLAWNQRPGGELAYHIILVRAAQRSLVVIADIPELHLFLQEHDIPIV